MSKSVIAAIAAAAVALVAVLVGIQVLGGDDAPAKASDFQGVDEVAALVQGIPQQGQRLGRADAPVKIVEYIDYKCPVCAAASTTVVPALIDDWIRPGKASIELRPLSFIGPDSERGALAGLAAAEQDKMWQFTELMLRNQGDENDEWITDSVVKGAAEAAGLDTAAFTTAYEGDGIVSTFQAATTSAQADGVSATPTWVITGPGGRQMLTGPDPDKVGAAVTKAATK